MGLQAASKALSMQMQQLQHQVADKMADLEAVQRERQAALEQLRQVSVCAAAFAGNPC